MTASNSDIPEELEMLGKAVRTFGRFEIQALARKLIYQLQRFPASGIFEERGFKTLWDEFCFNSQEGPFDLPEVGARGWDQTLDGFLDELVARIAKLVVAGNVRRAVLKWGRHWYPCG